MEDKFTKISEKYKETHKSKRNSEKEYISQFITAKYAPATYHFTWYPNRRVIFCMYPNNMYIKYILR